MQNNNRFQTGEIIEYFLFSLRAFRVFSVQRKLSKAARIPQYCFLTCLQSGQWTRAPCISNSNVEGSDRIEEGT